MDDAGRCYASFANDRLIVGNALIERTWIVRHGRLWAERFEDKRAGCQWIARPAEQASLVADGPAADGPLQFSSEVHRSSPVSTPSLRVTLSNRQVEYNLRIYPGAAGVEMQLVTSAAGIGTSTAAAATAGASGVESDASQPAESQRQMSDVIDAFAIEPLHTRLTQVTLIDQTDVHDNLAAERSWLIGGAQGPIQRQGNLFWIERTISGEGLIFLKCCPLPHTRPVKSDADLLVAPDGLVALLGHGIDGGGEGYPAVVLSYQGGRIGRIRALQAWQRQVRRYEPKRDAKFLANTWGDRSRDGRINETFMAREIAAGRELGVDVVQIDDGWQRGTSANSVNRDKGGVWNGFWAADANFWDPHPERFPAGIAAITDRARQAGLKMGLWFAPDSSNDFANWHRDAAAVLRMHREWGVDYVKIDGVKAHTRAGERNLRRFFDTVLAESDGRVVFDLDVTAEVRPGYFGMMHTGPIFVENRYTDWHRYWPHRTLRNLWMLSHYIDPLRLRMEFLNNQRNAECYGDDPLAPSMYRPDYLFATVMFANPLGWFEISNLPPQWRQELAPLVTTWKAHREAIFSGTIIPIGHEPDGTQWTGFCSLAPDEKSAYVLVFRELAAGSDWWIDCAQLGLLPRTVRTLAGDGEATVDADGLRVKIPDPRRFALLHVSGE